MDFINIGAIGFAQFGSDDYYNKRQIEKQVTLEFMETDVFKIPEQFQRICYYTDLFFRHVSLPRKALKRIHSLTPEGLVSFF
jgi:hypothetical protein